MALQLGTSASDIARAADILRDGGTVIFPTETVYGLGADGLNPRGVARIYEIKKRPLDHPLILHVGDLEEVLPLVETVPYAAQSLIETFWPGPLTLVLKRSDTIPAIVCGGLPSIAIRVPSHPVARALLTELKRPIAAPSANSFGHLSSTQTAHAASLFESVDAVIEGGKSHVGVESTIVSFLEDTPCLLRAGGIPSEAIEAVLGRINRAAPHSKSIAPGMLASHYAPRTPLQFIRSTESFHTPVTNYGILAFDQIPKNTHARAAAVLSPERDLNEAAAELFSALHKLDAQGLSTIYAFEFPNEGLGVAINDRLKRASR